MKNILSFILQLDTLERSQLAARLTLNCSDNYVEPQKLKDVYVTIIDVSKTYIHVCTCAHDFSLNDTTYTIFIDVDAWLVCVSFHSKWL